MKYKVGDPILLKAVITSVDESLSDLPYEWKLQNFSDRGYCGDFDIAETSDQKRFPREMWVWDEGRESEMGIKTVVYFHQDTSGLGYGSVLTITNKGDHFESSWYDYCREIEPINLTIEEAKQIISDAKGYPIEDINIETK